MEEIGTDYAMKEQCKVIEMNIKKIQPWVDHVHLLE